MQAPMQQQQFAAGGAIMAPGATPAVGATMGTLGNYNSQNNNNGNSPPRKDEKDILGGFKKEDGSFNPAALGPVVGILAGQSVGDSFKGFANSMIGPVPRLFGFKGFADGGVVGLRGGGDPGSFYRDFSDRREDNRLNYLDAMRERIKQSAPRGGMPPTNVYGAPNPYVATAVYGGPYDLDETVETSVSKLADQDRWSNPRGTYFPGPNLYSKSYGTRPGPTPTPMGIGEYPKAAVGEPAPPITYDYPDPSAEGPRASGGLRDAARNREAIRNTVMLDSLPNSEPPPAVNAFSFLPPQSTYVPFDPNNPDPATGNSYGPNDEAAFTPGPIPQGKGPVVPGAQFPPSSRRQTSPPGGGIPDAGGPGGGAGRRGGGSPNGGIGAALNPDLDGFVGQVRGLQLPDRFGEIEARNQQERDDLKAGRESDKGLALLKAGMTMAGGTSSNALSNISAGVTAGISEWSAAEKEFRVANQAIRSAENAIQIARANRDERQLEMAVKVKMHFEEMREKAAARRDAAGAAAGARSDAASARADAREERVLDRAESRALREAGSIQSSINTLSTSIDRNERLLTAMGTSGASPEEQKALRERIAAQEAAMHALVRDLSQLRGGIADRSGRVTTSPTTKSAYDRMPSGTQYTAPDGTVRTKP
jgi:hypothetical protein